MTERLHAARKVVDLLTSFRKSGRPVPAEITTPDALVVALADDTLEHVLARVTAYTLPVTVAVWDQKRDQLAFCRMHPSHDKPDQGVEVSPATTIGMLIDVDQQLSLPGRWDEGLRMQRIMLGATS